MTTPEENEVLVQFKAHLVKEGVDTEGQNCTDFRMLGWLRMEDYKLHRATNLLKKSIEWQKRFEFPTLLNWEPPVSYKTTYPYRTVGRDNAGRPVVVLSLGLWDIKKAVNSGERETWLKYAIQMFESFQADIRASSAELGREITQYIPIVDTKDFAYSQMLSLQTIEVMMEMMKTMEVNFPDSIYRCFVVNSSKVWIMCWNLVKVALSKRTSSKVELFSDPAQTTARLLKDIPAEQLPKEYGGLK